METMKFYEVTAKCGHVGGRDKYILINFYTVAEDGKTAAAAVRNAGRVKHHHKDAIRSVREITSEEYRAGQEVFYADPYNTCQNSQEQKVFWALIEPRVLTEEPEPFERKPFVRNDKRSLRYGYDKWGKRLWEGNLCA